MAVVYPEGNVPDALLEDPQKLLTKIANVVHALFNRITEIIEVKLNQPLSTSHVTTVLNDTTPIIANQNRKWVEVQNNGTTIATVNLGDTNASNTAFVVGLEPATALGNGDGGFKTLFTSERITAWSAAGQSVTVTEYF